MTRRAVTVVALAGVVAACSSGGGEKSAGTTAAPGSTPTPTDAAATVNGVAIAKSDFDADLRDYAANALFTATGVAGDVSNGTDSDSARSSAP